METRQDGLDAYSKNMHSSCADIAILIVNWNKEREVLDLLASLVNCSYNSCDIYVVDNASADDSVDLMRSHYPDVRLLLNDDNLGGTGGFNTGLRYLLGHGDYKFAWMLDNDVIVQGGALEALLDVMKADSQTGIVGSKILHADDVSVISETGALISGLASLPVPQLYNQPDREESRILEVDYVAACSLLVRMACVRELGVMDDNYFLMWDDMEWGMRFRRAGYRVMATTDSAVIHRGFSERNITPDFVYYCVRNHLYFTSSIYSGPMLFYYLTVLYAIFYYRVAVYNQRNSTRPLAEATRLAIQDCWAGAMGPNQHRFVQEGRKVLNSDVIPVGCKNVLLSTEKPVTVIKHVVSILAKTYPSVRITLVVNHSRENMFHWFQGGSLINKTRTGLGENVKFDAFIRFDDETFNPCQYSGKILVDINDNADLIGIRKVPPWLRMASKIQYMAVATGGAVLGTVKSLGGYMAYIARITGAR